MERIEPTIGDITIAEPTAADRELASRRRRATATCDRLLAWQAGLMVLLALLAGWVGLSAYLEVYPAAEPVSYVALFTWTGVLLIAAYFTTYRGVTGLVFALGTPLTIVVLNLVLADGFAWLQLFPVFMVVVGVCAAVEWRRSRA